MKNNYIKVKIEGKNVNNYLKWLIKKHITIININIIKHNLMEIIIEYSDYKKLLNYSKTYKIKIIQRYGKLKIIDILKNNIHIILGIMVSLIILYLLSNTIFSIDIIYNDKDLVNKINKELEKIKKENEKLELDFNVQKENNKNFSKDYQTLSNQLKQLEYKSKELQNESKQLDDNIQEIQKRIREKNEN